MSKSILNREENPKKRMWANIAYVAFALLALFLMLSAWGVFNNYLSFDGKYSPWYMKVVGTLLFICWCFFTYKVVMDHIKPTRWTPAIILVGLIFSVAFTLNFSFSGKDIQMHETVFYANGKVNYSKLDRWVERSKEFYDAKGIDTATFMPYVRMYGEFPGINKQSSLIRSGSIEKSTAPRANEDFPLPFDK